MSLRRGFSFSWVGCGRSIFRSSHQAAPLPRPRARRAFSKAAPSRCMKPYCGRCYACISPPHMPQARHAATTQTTPHTGRRTRQANAGEFAGRCRTAGPPPPQTEKLYYRRDRPRPHSHAEARTARRQARRCAAGARAATRRPPAQTAPPRRRHPAWRRGRRSSSWRSPSQTSRCSPCRSARSGRRRR
eukprot:3259157-Prymnesium_polylepis.1